VAAVALVALEAAVLAGYALTVVPSLAGARLAMGVTTVGFFWVYAAGLAFCAWRLLRLQSWARAPVVLAQLIQVMVGVSFWGGATTAIGVGLVLLGVVVLVGVFHPASIAALAAD
jgi:hypothetical protein